MKVVRVPARIAVDEVRTKASPLVPASSRGLAVVAARLVDRWTTPDRRGLQL